MIYSIEVVTCCCGDYLKFLKLTLPENMKLGGTWLVVTTLQDLETQAFCRSVGVNYVCANPYASASTPGIFNHGHMINAGLEHLVQGDWVVHVDSDVLLPPGAFDLDTVNMRTLGVLRRVFSNSIANLPYVRKNPEYYLSQYRSGYGGYYQAVNPAQSFFNRIKRWYPEQWFSAGHSLGKINNDNVLLRMFSAINSVTVLPGLCIHLGEEGLNSTQADFWKSRTEVLL